MCLADTDFRPVDCYEQSTGLFYAMWAFCVSLGQYVVYAYENLQVGARLSMELGDRARITIGRSTALTGKAR